MDVGSVDINGSAKSYFSNCDYLGIDVAPGKGVDLVCKGEEYDGPDNYFDTVVSGEVMEHNPHWVETMRNMIRVCKPGGLVIMTCAGLGRGEHGTTRTADDPLLSVQIGWDYYRNLKESDFRKSGAVEGLECVFIPNYYKYDLYMVGIKSPASQMDISKLKSIKYDYRKFSYASWKAIRRAIRLNLLNVRN